MTIFNKQMQVKYSCEQMYHLVSDVDAYAKFIPLCSSSKILATTDQQLKVSFTIAKGPLCFDFTTINSYQANQFITMKQDNGPFRFFKGIWRFTPVSANQSIISLHLEFEFINSFLCLVLNSLFHQLCESMIEAFCQRADFVYR